MSPSATPATQNEGGCCQVPRLPRKVLRRNRRHQSQPSAISRAPAMQNEGRCLQVPRLPRGGCCQVPRLPRKVPRRHRRPIQAQARHQSQSSGISATPATQNEGRCLQVPRLPRETKVDVAKCHACHAKCRGVTGDQSQPKRATRASPVPRLPRKTKVDVSKCHACHVKRRWMLPSATPATQSVAASPATNSQPKRATRASPVL